MPPIGGGFDTLAPSVDVEAIVPTRFYFSSTSDDSEVRAIEFIQKILDGLNKNSRRRVLNFIQDREESQP